MSSTRNKVFTGLSLPLATHRAADGEVVELSDNDISGLEGVNPLYRAMRSAFKEKLGKPYLVGAEIHMALLTKEGEIAYTASQVLEDLLVTAAQLQKNAKLEQPLPLGKVVSHMGLCKVLLALSTAHRKSGTRLVICTEEGDSEAPILDADDFIEPVRDDLQNQTGTFRITGLYRDDQTHQCGFLLTRSRVLVLLPQDDPRWSWDRIKSALDVPTNLVGTIARANKSSDWMPEPGARLEGQKDFEEMRHVAAA
jgi:hypothetical protein